MMNRKMSEAVLISIGNLVSFVSFILWCTLYSCMIPFQDLYTSFFPFLRLFLYLLPHSWKTYDHRQVSDTGIATSSRPGSTRKEVQQVMENLGLLEEPLEDSFEIAEEFELEFSWDEVAEAFKVFDDNNDGFIDAGELHKVMNSLGLTGFDEQDCKKMIMAFDENGDGRVDLGEFVRLMDMEDCSCSMF